MIRKVLYKETEQFGIKEKIDHKKKYGYEYKGYQLSISIYEFEPSARNILYYHEIKEQNINYFLSFPYVQVVAVVSGNYGSVFAGMTRTPYDPVKNPNCYVPPLPNCYRSFAVCGINATHDNVADLFWNSSFHGDAYDGNEYLQKSSMKNLNVWQKMSKMAPSFIMSEGCDYGNKAKPLLPTILSEI